MNGCRREEIVDELSLRLSPDTATSVLREQADPDLDVSRLADRSPVHIPGPEFIARAVAEWCRFNGFGSVFIDPGSPWRNAWSRASTAGWQFGNLLEAQVIIEDWRVDYNNNRLHSAHGDLTPNEFARAWQDRNQPALA